MTISRAKIAEIVIINGIGLVAILHSYGTFSYFIRHLQFRLNGSPNAVDQAEKESEDADDSTLPRLLLKGSMNSGEDAQICGLQSAIAMGNSQQKVKTLDNANHSARVIKNPVHAKPKTRGKMQDNANHSARVIKNPVRAIDLKPKTRGKKQDIAIRPTWVTKGPIRRRGRMDVMQEITDKIQKIKNGDESILADVCRSSYLDG